MSDTFIIETSARHVHLSQEHLEILFGAGAVLTRRKDLSQPGQYACEERVTVVGPKRELASVIVLGPVRPQTQVELSATDARNIGVAAPLRESGDLAGSAGCRLIGPCGEVDLTEGVIVAKRHLHMTPADARRLGVTDRQSVWVLCESESRTAVLGSVICRVSEQYALAMHIDTDEANAVGGASVGRIIPPPDTTNGGEAMEQTQNSLPSTDSRTLCDGRTALVIVDMVNGFLTEGVMSSPLCEAVLPAVEQLLRFAKENAIPCVAFADCHAPDCIEFTSFPPHCIRGTSESEIAPSLRAIGGYETIEKNSTNGAITPAFQEWLGAHGELTRIVVCGVCTDICVMQFCLTLKTLCNQNDRPMEVLLPVNAAATYDAPGHDAAQCGGMALQLMQQAGITLTAEVQYNG